MEERVTIYLTASPMSVLVSLKGLSVTEVSYRVNLDYIPISIHLEWKLFSRQFHPIDCH